MVRCSLIALAAFVLVLPAHAYDKEAWLADFAQIKQVFAERAPNLDWSKAERGIDPVQVAIDTEIALGQASTDVEARQVIRDFISKFGDGHISVAWPDEKEQAAGTWGTASICKGLGFEDEDRPAGLPFSRVGGQAVETPDSDIFPIQIVEGKHGKVGVLRIPSFYEWGYYKYCPQAVAQVGLPEDGECGEECGAAIGHKAAELLTDAVARQIEKLKAENVSAIAVDITQNGGGSLWLDPIARMLTPVKLKAPKLAFTRTQNWLESFTRSLQAVDADLANPIVGIGYRGILTKAKATLEAAVAEADQTCDRSGIWLGETPTCSILAPEILYATGVLDYATPGEYSLLYSSSAIFFSSLYSYQEGLWRGPLYVLMDEGSASAAEHFATLLKDNDAAILIGEPTFGAGCGWMSGGDQSVILTRTEGELFVPDCIWTRQGGHNEVAGVEPDILVPWRFYDNPFQKAKRVVDILRELDFQSWPTVTAPQVTSKSTPKGG